MNHEKSTAPKKEYTSHYESPLGLITMASDGTNLTGLWFEKQQHYAYTLSSDHQEMKLPVFRETCKWLDIYFTGRDPGFTPPLAFNVTPFRKRVCEIMLTIPFGFTMSYGDIARILEQERNSQTEGSAAGKPVKRMSAQAVGGAVGHNPISLIVPCHRVIGSDRSLTGYGGGLDRKIALLDLESIKYKL